ncbi:AcrB/AcrD/AcrF family protein [Methanosarcina sp. UBA289]|uniref:AcrB/AcrD/AcrF family protein n=1 Tax=Methanosarcina sp. UBA289 TaxID=1915574 RepID=UPI0025F6E44C|nr:AcrB/AcrD/AcrF family protein [Methanosarcina sp. UBA289]
MAEKNIITEVFDIVFIFVLAFACVVIPTVLQGAVLVSWEEGGSGIGFVWDPVGFFSLLLVIVAFFAVILYHSVKHYKY